MGTAWHGERYDRPPTLKRRVGPQVNQCRATKLNGERCQGTANGPAGWCWAHAPEHAEQRRRQASRAARSKPNREVATLKQDVKDTIAMVKDGEIDRNDAGVMFRGYSVLLDFIKVERGVLEVEELAREIEELRERRGAS